MSSSCLEEEEGKKRERREGRQEFEFIKEEQPDSCRRRSSLLIRPIFLSLVHIVWWLKYKSFDDKSIKGSFPFIIPLSSVASGFLCSKAYFFFFFGHLSVKKKAL